MKTNPQEEIKQSYLQEVVEYMCTCKASPISSRCAFVEGEAGREVIVCQEA